MAVTVDAVTVENNRLAKLMVEPVTIDALIDRDSMASPWSVE